MFSNITKYGVACYAIDRGIRTYTNQLSAHALNVPTSLLHTVSYPFVFELGCFGFEKIYDTINNALDKRVPINPKIKALSSLLDVALVTVITTCISSRISKPIAQYALVLIHSIFVNKSFCEVLNGVNSEQIKQNPLNRASISVFNSATLETKKFSKCMIVWALSNVVAHIAFLKLFNNVFVAHSLAEAISFIAKGVFCFEVCNAQ